MVSNHPRANGKSIELRTYNDFVRQPVPTLYVCIIELARARRKASEVMNEFSDGNRADELFRLAVESSPCAMVMVDSGGKIVLVNSQTVKLFGYARSELIGQPIEMLVPDTSPKGPSGPSRDNIWFNRRRGRWRPDGSCTQGIRTAGRFPSRSA